MIYHNVRMNILSYMIDEQLERLARSIRLRYPKGPQSK